jgi:hypothetical protein
MAWQALRVFMDSDPDVFNYSVRKFKETRQAFVLANVAYSFFI